ncbi:HAAS signaling domain-containing protein [Bacillus sp. B-jedd]|uniref:HAAS signaling domain-containing protein n=1 Tax=Bacillus sp. B-jedd TaxID=1476857 RepID=UPI00051565E7|nr:membrane protein [Bacillus sp. B-jedd]CEG27278.1 integral inner membrane protein [Bacillus sp. B-jedd]
MERLKNDFLKELDRRLGTFAEKESILRDYEEHLDEMLVDSFSLGEEEAREALYARLGTPKEIADMWKEELTVTPSNMKWLFILLNILLFAAGSALTAAHNVFEWEWLSFVWRYLTSIPFIIAFVYIFFWALLGYEIGRSFGSNGRGLVRKTFLAALIPNLTLMVLTLTGIIPYEWFYPLLTKTFIAVCIILTALLYPICLFAYQWGKKSSV